MNPLSATYRLLAAARNRFYDSGMFSGRLQAPVISVGGISAGGAGKTPFVILLGELLKQREIAFDILSRGYGRKSRGVKIVNPNGSADEFGDEPLLIARKLNAPVVVGGSRYMAGQLAEQKFGSQLHLLDDGFQHRELARDFDIILLTAKDVSDQLFPMGRLREPVHSLRRADAVVLMDGLTEEAIPERTRAAVQTFWRAERSIRIGDALPRQVAFCGIARAQNFFHALREAGLEPAAEISFRDHHFYRERDIQELLRARDLKKTSGFVTTEKDAVNLGEFFHQLEPIKVISLKIELEDPESAMESMLSTLAARRQARP